MKRASRAPCSGSKPLRKTDRRTASQADRRVEQGIGRRAFSPCGERGVTMRAFVVAKLRNRAGQLGIVAVLLQLAQLARIVPVDFLLDRRGAGHRRLGAEQRRRRAERVARDRPDRLQRGRADAATGDHGVEFGFVADFLLRRGSYLGRMRGAIAHHGQLPGVDAGGAVFARLVDADHRGTVSHDRRLLATSATMATAAIVEMVKLKPASEIPAKVHGATTQSTRGAIMIPESGSPPASTVLAQAVMPSHQPYSTPA